MTLRHTATPRHATIGTSVFVERKMASNDRLILRVLSLTIALSISLDGMLTTNAFANDSETAAIASEIDDKRVAPFDLNSKAKTKTKTKTGASSANPIPLGNATQPSHNNPQSSPGVELAKNQMKELVPLLDRLKKRAPHQYEKAIRDLDRSAKRLEAIRKRDEKLFDASLREWTTRSEIQLRKAKLRVANSVADAEQVERLQRTLISIQIEKLEREIELNDLRKKGYEDRIKTLKRQLTASTENRRSPATTKKPARGNEKDQAMDSQKSP
jgi:hypothetical protein